MLLSFIALFGFVIEIIMAFLLEPLIWKAPMQKWGTGPLILHWIIICIIWLLLSIFIIKKSQKDFNFNPFVSVKKPNMMQWFLIFSCIIISIIITWIDWNGPKFVIEFHRQGLLKFIFQYIYYFFEVFLFLLIIVYAQKAFEIWFQKPNIPYGGIITALTWGLMHLFTKKSLFAGLISTIGGFCFGVIYLISNRNIKLTYIILCIMFIL